MRGLQLTCIVLLATTTGSNALVVPLDRWTFRSANGSVRVDNASVPGTSHIHLMEAGVIGDPYYRFNERENQWVAQETWTYETHVTLPSDDINSKKTSLVFETLDGVALVTVNGKQVAITANSFVPAATGVNQIQVEFQPVLQYTREQADTYPYFVPATENFNTWTEPTRRSFVRKAGSDFGWDWGRPAYIEFTESVVKLKDLQVGQVFPVGNEDLSNVDVTVRVTLDGGKVKHENKETSIMTTIPEDWQEDAVIDISFRLENPSCGGLLDMASPTCTTYVWMLGTRSSARLFLTRAGFASVELVQDDTNAGYVAGKTFYFKINCVPIFIKGANWIPTDSFPTRTKPPPVRAANMNMLRVWGGGRYESDLFYVECDRLGILVWQELMFACGMYPRDTAFLQNVLKEVGFQIQQSLCYQTAIQTWRRGKNPELGMTMGILYWQLNDIWQGSKLTLRGKAEFAPFIISIHERSDGEAVEVYAVSDLRRTKCGSLVKTIDRQAIAIAALESRSIEELDIDTLLDHDTTSCHRRSCFLHVRCVAKSSVTGLETAACEDTHHFFAPYKTSTWAGANVELVATDFVALFVEVDAPSVLGYWSSNSFLMVGHETKTLNFTEATSEDADKLSVDAFSRLVTVNWLQKSYDNSVEDMAVQ
ncbi:Glycoside hydrolase superfamily [Phytophthora cactorum]|nr:Glycoside hydrolase superfamily [Phytophthora cactorum]